MIDLTKIAAGREPPRDLNVIVEIPFGGPPVKYEVDKVSGLLFADRFLQTCMYYPGNYGFIPHTLSEDGDPSDVVIAGSVPVISGSVVRCRPIGALLMEDEHGPDEKILAVPIDAVQPSATAIRSYRDLAPEFCAQVAHFFQHYKDLEEENGLIQAAGLMLLRRRRWSWRRCTVRQKLRSTGVALTGDPALANRSFSSDGSSPERRATGRRTGRWFERLVSAG